MKIIPGMVVKFKGLRAEEFGPGKVMEVKGNEAKVVWLFAWPVTTVRIENIEPVGLTASARNGINRHIRKLIE